MSNWQPSAAVTLVGSMPHQDRDKVIEMILREIPEVPAWPQLPRFQAEQMMIQYLEGLPGVQSKNGSVFVRTDSSEFEQELYAFYEEYLEVESQPEQLLTSRFQMGSDTGKTFFRFLQTVEQSPNPIRRAVKGQITGPFTLLSGLKDHQDRALLYDDRLQDVVVKLLAMKARWQIRHLQTLGCPIILFVDEPALAGFGSSAFISVSRELIQSLLRDVIEAIQEAGAMAAIHVCANTDWLLAFDSGVDIINFDGYNYFEKFALYQEAFTEFMKRGGFIAWGMVPTTDVQTIEHETAQGLADRWAERIELIASPRVPVAEILTQSLFTPSCGCGSLTEAAAERVVRITRELGEIMQKQVKGA